MGHKLVGSNQFLYDRNTLKVNYFIKKIKFIPSFQEKQYLILAWHIYPVWL